MLKVSTYILFSYNKKHQRRECFLLKYISKFIFDLKFGLKSLFKRNKSLECLVNILHKPKLRSYEPLHMVDNHTRQSSYSINHNHRPSLYLIKEIETKAHHECLPQLPVYVIVIRSRQTQYTSQRNQKDRTKQHYRTHCFLCPYPGLYEYIKTRQW